MTISKQDGEKAVELSVALLEQYGCESALIGSIWQASEHEDWEGVVKALGWAWYVSSSINGKGE